MGRKTKSSPHSVLHSGVYKKENGRYKHLVCPETWEQFHPETSITTSGHFSIKYGIWFSSFYHFQHWLFKNKLGPYADVVYRRQLEMTFTDNITPLVIRKRKRKIDLDVVRMYEDHVKTSLSNFTSTEEVVIKTRKERIEALMREVELESPFVGNSTNFPSL